MVTRANLARTLRTLGLERYEATLACLARPAIRIAAEACDDAELPIGGSKLGGRPDLPGASPWPARDGCPLSFIAQLDCGELQRFESGALLPPSGLLSFFYDAQEQPWGRDSDERDAWHVRHHPPSDSLARRAFPPDVSSEDDFGRRLRFRAKRLAFRELLTFPGNYQYADLEALRRHWTPDDAGFAVEAHEVELLHHLYEDPEKSQTEHQLFGYPSVIQNPMQPELAEVTGVDADAWRLLLQVDSQDDMMWGDLGMVYFWIPGDALRERAFDRTWLILQC